MKKLSDAFGRTTHKFMTKIGKAEETHDPEYEAAKERCLSEGKRLKLIAKHTEKHMQLLQSNTVVFGEVVDEFATLNAGGPGVAELTAALKEVEEARTKAEAALQSDLCSPVYHFYEQYKLMKRRMNVLETRRTDMDRFHTQVLKITEKTTGGRDGLGEADAKYRAAREAYEKLHDEMMADFARLHEELKPFLGPAAAVFMREQARYAEAYGAAMGRLSAFAGSVDTSRLVGYPHVITPAEASAAGAGGLLPEKKDKSASSSASTTATTTTATPAPAPTPASTTTATPASAPPPARPLPTKKQERCRALYNFQGEDATELSFKKGDIIVVTGKQGEWWEGEANGKKGLFPANYVQLIE